MKFCERKDLIDRQSYVAQYVSLAMFTIGVTTMLGSDDLLAAFSCGTAFAWDGFFNRQTEQAVFSSVIDLLFNIAAFIFIGAWMPFNEFDNAQLTLSVWRLIVIAILILLLRRLPVVLALYRWIPDIKTFREAVSVATSVRSASGPSSYQHSLFPRCRRQNSRPQIRSSSWRLPFSRSWHSWCCARSPSTACPSHSLRSDARCIRSQGRGLGTSR